jgi:uncharacterized protein YcfJ
VKALLAGLAAIGVIAVIFVGSYYGGIIGNHVQANYQKRVVTNQVQQAVRTPGFAQSAYERFFDLCASVQTAETNLGTQYGQLKNATGDDKTRIDTNIAGLVSTRADAINTYNAEAAEYTHGQFRDRNLPYRLDTSPYKEGDHTQCAA